MSENALDAGMAPEVDALQWGIGTVVGFGSSNMTPYGIDDNFKGFLSHLATMLGADEDNNAQGGSLVAYPEQAASTEGTPVGNGGVGRVLDRIANRVGQVGGLIDNSIMSQRELCVTNWGPNDLGVLGNGTGVTGGQTVMLNAYRRAISLMRAAKTFEESDVFGVGTWTAASNTVTVNSTQTSGGTTNIWRRGMYFLAEGNTGPGFPTGTKIERVVLTGGVVTSLVLDQNAGIAGTSKFISGSALIKYDQNYLLNFEANIGLVGERHFSGGAAKCASAINQAITIDIPAWYTGGGIALHFVQDASLNSAQWSVTYNGSAVVGPTGTFGLRASHGAGSPFDFRDAVAQDFGTGANKKRTSAVIRLMPAWQGGPPSGAGTIVLTPIAKGTGGVPGWFDGMTFEALVPTRVMMILPAYFPVYTTLLPFTATDADIDTLRTALVGLKQEFDDHVFLCDFKRLLDKSASNYNSMFLDEVAEGIATTTNATNTLTAATTSFGTFTKGMTVTGTGVGANAKITSNGIVTGTITVDVNSTASATVGITGTQKNVHFTELAHSRLTDFAIRCIARALGNKRKASTRAFLVRPGYLSLHPRDQDRNLAETRNPEQSALTIRLAKGQDWQHPVQNAMVKAPAQRFLSNDNELLAAVAADAGIGGIGRRSHGGRFLRADQSTTSATVNNTGLGTDLGIVLAEVGQTICFRYDLIVDTAAATTGLQIGLFATDGLTTDAFNSTHIFYAAAPGPTVAPTYVEQGGLGTLQANTASAGTVRTLYIIQGRCHVTARGGLRPEFRSELATSAVNVRIGSMVQYMVAA